VDEGEYDKGGRMRVLNFLYARTTFKYNECVHKSESIAFYE